MRAKFFIAFFVIFTIFSPSLAIADMLHRLAAILYPKDGPDGLLWVACSRGEKEEVKEALDEGANINSLNRLGNSCLHFLASKPENEEIYNLVLLLIRRGADVNVRTFGGKTPLYGASGHGNFSIVKLLLSKGANPNLSETDGDTPLMRAARNGYLRIVKILVQNGANISQKDIDGEDAIKNALEAKKFRIAEYLKKMKGKR